MRLSGVDLKSIGARTLRSTTEPRSVSYERLMQVSLRHTYYNASGELCPDFVAAPTQSSMDLMASLGLLFRQEGAGFSVLLNRNHGKSDRFGRPWGSAVSWVQSRRALASPFHAGPWARLSFTLTTKNSMFVNFTAMPIDTSASTGAYYLSNIEATQSSPAGECCLHRGPLVHNQLPLTGSQYAVCLSSPATRQVVVRDISGEVAICQPAYWWLNPPPPASSTPCCPGPDPKESDIVRRNPVYLDFSPLPEDKYSIEECAELTDCHASPLQPEVVYAYSVPAPMFFIDLLFTRPPGVSTGVYPIDPHTGTITPTQYLLDFAHRSTTWNYYVVSTAGPLTDLQIESIAPTPRPVAFTGPTAVTLPNGQRASQFVSNDRIPLEEQSTYRFQLKGKAGGLKTKDGVLMSRMPVASARQVIPRKGDYATDSGRRNTQSAVSIENYSDIYVYI